MSFVNGQGRLPLVNTVQVVSGGTFPTSLVFGSFPVAECAGICGMIKVDSSQNNVAVLNLAYQTDSGVTLITSSLLVNSGGMAVNEFNPAPYVNISVSQINSGTPVRVYLAKLPIR